MLHPEVAAARWFAVGLVVCAGCHPSRAKGTTAADVDGRGGAAAVAGSGAGAGTNGAGGTGGATNASGGHGADTGGASGRALQGPPTAETCSALAVPAGAQCHWVLVPSHYCGGPPPPAEMLWPACSCEPCGVDADCAGADRCATLPTDAECGVTTQLCVGAASPCTDDAACPAGERCMAVDGKPTCKVPTIYPPRP